MSMNLKVSKLDRWFATGYQAHQAGHFDKAEQYYQRVLRLNPTDAETLYLFGTIRVQQKRWPEAIEWLSRARKIRPRHPETLNNLGLALQESEDFVNAKTCLETAIAEKPDYANAHNNLARIFEHDGMLENP